MSAPPEFALSAPNDRPPLSEAEVSRDICAFLRSQGWVVVRNHVGKFVPYATAIQAIELLIQQMQGGEEPSLETAKQHIRLQVVQMGEPGMSDLLAVHAKMLPVWTEIKRPGRTMDDHQYRWAERMRVAGFRIGSWDSLDSFRAYYYCHIAKT